MRAWIRVVVFAFAMQLGAIAAGPASAADAQYYWLEAGTQRGPVTLPELQNLLATKVVAADALVWTAGMPQWAPAKTVPELLTQVAVESGTEYYVLEGSDRLGPMSLDAVLQRIKAGETGAEELVWKAGLADWVRADSLPELATGFGAPPKPTPPPKPAHLNADTITMASVTADMSEVDRKKSSMILGAVLGIMFHELGHAIIGELGVPSTGPEEDAADEFSSLLIGTAFKQENFTAETPEQKQWIKGIVQYSTLIWRYMRQNYQKQGLETPWYDEHSDNGNRFRNTFCRIYGSDPDEYKELADIVELPENQRGLCAYEYPKHYKAWITITAPFARDMGDGSGVPGNLPLDTPGRKVTVEFQKSANGTGEALTQVFLDTGMFEGIAAALQKGFVWKNRDLKILFRDCGVVNAFYDPNDGTVNMCWEGMEYFAGVVLDAEGVPRH